MTSVNRKDAKESPAAASPLSPARRVSLAESKREEIRAKVATLAAEAREAAAMYGDASTDLVTEILEGVAIAFGKVDEKALRKGATWGRKQIRGPDERAPGDRARQLVQLARDVREKLSERVESAARRGEPHEPSASAHEIAFVILRSGLVAPAALNHPDPLGALTASIRGTLATYAKDDLQLLTKRSLMASGFSEPDANNCVESAFRKERGYATRR